MKLYNHCKELSKDLLVSPELILATRIQAYHQNLLNYCKRVHRQEVITELEVKELVSNFQEAAETLQKLTEDRYNEDSTGGRSLG